MYLFVVVGEHPDGPGKVLVALCLVLLTAGVEEAGESGYAQGQVLVLGKELVQVVSPQGPRLYLPILNLHRRTERLVRFFKPERKRYYNIKVIPSVNKLLKVFTEI